MVAIFIWHEGNGYSCQVNCIVGYSNLHRCSHQKHWMGHIPLILCNRSEWDSN